VIEGLVDTTINLTGGVTPFLFGCGHRPRWEIRGKKSNEDLATDVTDGHG
jgi:hypothetical protein